MMSFPAICCNLHCWKLKKVTKYNIQAFSSLYSPLKCYKEEEVTIIIRKTNEFVKHGQNVVKNRNFIPKWGVNDHKTCHVKFSLLQMGSFKLKVVILDIRRST